MRLTKNQQAEIVSTVKNLAGESARIFLYGSRLDDLAKGGDVDILVESRPELSLLQRAKIKQTLERELALPVDVLACEADAANRPFVGIVRKKAILLGEL
jgi:predicted nucleotidyltransferase